MKTRGIISSGRNVEDWTALEMLWPFFFVGVRLDNKSGSLIHEILLHNDNPLDRDAIEIEFKLSALKDGQFFLSHQFGGNRCVQAEMFGAVLPLKLCGRRGVSDRLNVLIDKYDLAYPDDFEKAIPDFKAFGLPIHEQYLDGKIRYDHALLKIADTEQGIAFLRHNEFRYVTGIGGMSNTEFGERAKKIPGITVDPERFLADRNPPPKEVTGAWQALRDESDQSRHIAASAPAEWKGSADFADWLSRGPGYEVNPKDVVVALVWENYD